MTIQQANQVFTDKRAFIEAMHLQQLRPNPDHVYLVQMIAAGKTIGINIPFVCTCESGFTKLVAHIYNYCITNNLFHG